MPQHYAAFADAVIHRLIGGVGRRESKIEIAGLTLFALFRAV